MLVGKLAGGRPLFWWLGVVSPLQCCCCWASPSRQALYIHSIYTVGLRRNENWFGVRWSRNPPARPTVHRRHNSMAVQNPTPDDGVTTPAYDWRCGWYGTGLLRELPLLYIHPFPVPPWICHSVCCQPRVLVYTSMSAFQLTFAAQQDFAVGSRQAVSLCLYVCVRPLVMRLLAARPAAQLLHTSVQCSVIAAARGGDWWGTRCGWSYGLAARSCGPLPPTIRLSVSPCVCMLPMTTSWNGNIVIFCQHVTTIWLYGKVQLLQCLKPCRLAGTLSDHGHTKIEFGGPICPIHVVLYWLGMNRMIMHVKVWLHVEMTVIWE